jgi:hypothetical protein
MVSFRVNTQNNVDKFKKKELTLELNNYMFIWYCNGRFFWLSFSDFQELEQI